MKNANRSKKVASTAEIARMAKKIHWADIRLPSGDVVPAETTRAIFADALPRRQRKPRGKHLHATAA